LVYSEEKEKKETQERYWKVRWDNSDPHLTCLLCFLSVSPPRQLHAAGKTDQAKADLGRLAAIRKEREAAALKRKAEQEGAGSYSLSHPTANPFHVPLFSLILTSYLP
jgi:hypothetical protein